MILDAIEKESNYASSLSEGLLVSLGTVENLEAFIGETYSGKQHLYFTFIKRLQRITVVKG